MKRPKNTYFVQLHIDGQVSIDSLTCAEIREMHALLGSMAKLDAVVASLLASPLGQHEDLARKIAPMRAHYAQLRELVDRYPLELVERIERDARAGMPNALARLSPLVS